MRATQSTAEVSTSPRLCRASANSPTLPPMATTVNWTADVMSRPIAEIRSARMPAAEPSRRSSPADAWLWPCPSPLTPRLSFGFMSGLGIAAHAREQPDRVAIVDGDRRLTYRELYERACRTAHVLQGFGLKADDRIALALRNRSVFFEAGFAAAMLGIEVVPVSWRASRDELEYYLEDSGAKL